MEIWIIPEQCDGCRRCQRACLYEGIAVTDGKARVTERCTACGACVSVCPHEAIGSDIVPREIPDYSGHQGIWVFVQQEQGILESVSLELLGKAQELSQELDQTVSAVVLGATVAHLADTLADHGAHQVYVVEDPRLEPYRTTVYADVLERLVREHTPAILLMGATTLGRDLAPRLSRRVGAGLTADCTSLTIDPDEKILLQTRPAFGGNVMATIANRFSRPQMATVRPGVMTAVRVTAEAAAAARVIRVNPVTDLDDTRAGTRVLEILPPAQSGRDLAGARVIVAGGRGMDGEKGFAMLQELAGLLDGEVACTRLIVEQGLMPSSAQVGQTGQTVRPEIYIACGISGAIQHRAGMADARYIIAINKDPSAPIFDVANWGIVGDAAEIVPEMIAYLKGGQS